jgi:hypothetical protein
MIGRRELRSAFEPPGADAGRVGEEATTTVDGTASTREVYADRQARFTVAAAGERSRRDKLSRARLLVFGLIAAALGMALGDPVGGAIGWWVAAAALVVSFATLVRLQRIAEANRARSEELAGINRQALARTARSWAQLPPADFPSGTEPPVARDLDLFGEGSLFQLLGTAATASGRGILSEWLISPALPATVRQRQAAVLELKDQLELRQEIERLARHTPASGESIATFRRWAEGGGWLDGHPGHLHLARTLPVALIVLGFAHWSGILPPLWIALVPLNAIAWFLGARRIGAELAGVELRADDLLRFRDLLHSIEDASFQSQHLRSLRERLRHEGAPAHAWIRRLQRIVALAEVRSSPMAYLPLQLATLWDTHVLLLLDRWRSDAGTRVGDWFDAMGEFEALGALAGLAFDNPEWTFPTIDADAERWNARSIAHPLLPAESRVVNDVCLGPPGSFLLVTGSNMSGKSTLLRAIGINTVLAHAGGPVCAAAFSIPPTRLGTSFVIEDSLRTGVSFFMAELQRLKAIIDESSDTAAAPEWRYLFLLDEVLKGTNSGERQIAVRTVLLELIRRNAAGAISSHDLALADLPELRERSVPVHFRERYGSRNGVARMEFDYRLREGVATTTNALALLELIGIAPESPPR